MSATAPDDGLEPLTADECDRRLRESYVGRVGYVDAGRPVVVPVNYRVDDEGTILVLSAPGAKLDAACAGGPLCLQVDGIDDVYHAGWSVLVTGPTQVVDDPSGVKEAEGLLLRPWARRVERTHLIRIRPERVEGRRLRGTPAR